MAPYNSKQIECVYGMLCMLYYEYGVWLGKMMVHIFRYNELNVIQKNSEVIGNRKGRIHDSVRS